MLRHAEIYQDTRRLYFNMRARVGSQHATSTAICVAPRKNADIRDNMPKPKNFVPRSRNRFREVELARAIRAAKSAGGERVEIDPVTGKISVILTKSGEATSGNQWDEVLTDAADKKRSA